jgi:hypothetical protein
MACAAVRQIVTVNAGDYEIFQIHLHRHFGKPLRLGRVRRLGFALCHRTEFTVSRADIT